MLITAAPVPAVADDQAIFVAPLDTPDRITIRVIVPYTPERAGLAHYMEHLVVSPVLATDVALYDTHNVATTTPSSIIYSLSGKRNELTTILRRLAAVFKPISVSPAFALKERGIVQYEYDLRYPGSSQGKAIDAMEAFLYAGNPQALPVFATPEETGKLTLEEAKRLHQETHRPERAILFASGDITDAALREAAAEAGFPTVAQRQSLVPPDVTLGPPAEKVFTFAGESDPPLMLWSKVVELAEPVPFDLLVFQGKLLGSILHSVLLGGIAKPLTRGVDLKILVRDERHVELYVIAEPDAGVSFATLRTAVEKAFAESARGIPPDTFDRVMPRFRKDVPDPSDRPASQIWMDNYMFKRLIDSRPVVDEVALRALLDKVDPAGIDKLMAALGGPGRLAVSLIGEDPGP